MKVRTKVDRIEKIVSDKTNFDKAIEEGIDRIFQDKLIEAAGVPAEQARQYHGQELIDKVMDNRDCVEDWIRYLESWCSELCDPQEPARKLWIGIAGDIVEAFRRNPQWGPCREDIIPFYDTCSTLK